MLASFDETRSLSDGALRDLLGSEDPRSRVYAVWGLGLRAGGSEVFAARLGGEPEPGVRRALAVVLAGRGEIDLLVALARHDPDVHVRAHASQIVVRFAQADRIPWEVVAERFDDAPDVRAAIVSQIDVAAPASIHARVVACLEDADESVRREAFETAVKLHLAGLIEGDPLRLALDAVTPGQATNALAFWFSLAEPRAIASVLTWASRPVRGAALHLRPELALTELVDLIAEDPDLFQQLQYALKLSLAAAPLGLVLRVATRTPWNVEEAVARLAACDRVESELRDLLVELSTSCATSLVELGEVEAPSDALARRDDETDEDDEGAAWRDEPRANLEALIAHATRLLAAR